VLSRYREGVTSALHDVLDRPDLGHASFMRYHLGWEDAAGAGVSVTVAVVYARCRIGYDFHRADARQA
jgi:hypothetical protein